MQKWDLIHVSSSLHSYFIIKYLHVKVFRKSENAIQWAINLASLSYESIVCSQMRMSKYGSKGTHQSVF